MARKKTLEQVFSERFAALRDQADMSQAEVADAVGASQGTVGLWERGESLPKAGFLAAIGRLFDVSVDHLLYEEVPEVPRGFISERDTLKLLWGMPHLDQSGKDALLRVLDALNAEQQLKAVLGD